MKTIISRICIYEFMAKEKNVYFGSCVHCGGMEIQHPHKFCEEFEEDTKEWSE